MAKKDVKRIRIYEAALEVFARYGYRRARMEDVAEALHMTKGNLYLYVSNKRDLYEKAVAYALLKWQGHAKREADRFDDPVQKLAVYSTKGIEYLQQDPVLKAVLIDNPSVFPISPSEDPFYEINRASMDMLKEILKKGVDQKRFAAMDVDRVAELFYSIYTLFINKVYIKSEGESTLSMFEEGIGIVLNGLLARGD
ncbi:MAG TPA: TetR/AcrR family transcriptional regulator [Deltaproteobacteria bacterium]|nr:TetR/AcrR family transcriptional regulator [Deltaproteobacteria bacterium]